MIVAYVQRDISVECVEVGARQALPAGAPRFDLFLFEPTPEEKSRVQTAPGIALPMREIEPSSRLYVEGDVSYMTALALGRAQPDE